METVKVVIVGGGAAGLGAAKTLGSNVNYLIIEAQDYLGGRIRTVDAAPNVIVDMGAQFIHGQTNNMVYEICKQLNCVLPYTDTKNSEMLVLTSNRTQIDSEIMRHAIIVWEDILSEARAKFGDTTIPTHYPFSDYLLEHFKERLLTSLSCSNDLIDALVDHFNKSELIENGCLTLSNLSLSEYGSFEYLDGAYECEFKNGGYRPFISYMKSFIPDDNRIRLNSEVIRVKYLTETHQLLVDIRHHHKTSEQQQQISSIICDHIIWTSSLGTYRTEKNAINNMGFDTVNKVIMIYETSFWPKDVYEIIVLHTQREQPMELSESLKELLNTENIDVETVSQITEGIHRYDVLPSTDIPVLICWFGGPAAVLSENFSEKVIGHICHEVLCNYLNISPLLHQQSYVLKSEWYKNRFIRGSYSYYSIKSSTKDGEQLRTSYAPDGISRIQFAGEAMHEKFYSTVHGALESGIRAGNQLLEIMNK